MPGKFHHESLYRGDALLAHLATLRITLCGVGAVGSNLADALARQGVAHLRVIDHDRVEEHNVSTQLYGESDVGVWKVEALRNRLFRAVGIEIDAVRKELSAFNARQLLKDSDLIIDAFDNAASRQLVQDHARATATSCLHVGLFEDYCEAVWDERYRVPRDVGNDVCNYPLARNLVLIATAIAAEAVVRFIALGERVSWTATLRDFAVRPMDD
jgi:molybdopterin/thiamine biosynthesis adenylyltransferase